MSAFLSPAGNLVLSGLSPEKVQALIRAIEGAHLPDKQLLQHELWWLKNPDDYRNRAKKMADRICKTSLPECL